LRTSELYTKNASGNLHFKTWLETTNEQEKQLINY